ncbi:hypothetical protein BVC80_1719g52 [Macleaya cordata]|uniref:Uncharacterized protein n=1 Tax=Macleaya cordata TaxID=56857 RepID=A0A200Q2M8_MACCD|nr:hypothetical protein BVC80_1719g52 [Macleaya cordata]
MALKINPSIVALNIPSCPSYSSLSSTTIPSSHLSSSSIKIPPLLIDKRRRTRKGEIRRSSSNSNRRKGRNGGRMMISAALPPLDLTEDNVKQVLEDARTEAKMYVFMYIQSSLGVAELSEVDGPFVKISLRGRFWHERSMVLARLGNYLKQRIPEILEVDIEDEKQLDDSPENF